jgi:hypothetical protein
MSNLMSAVDELLALDVDAMSGPALLAQIAELRTQLNRAEAAYYRLLERADRSGATLADAGSTQAWLREQTRVSPSVAHRDVGLARDLADALPATRAAFDDGTISPAHAQAISMLRPMVADDTIARIEPHVIDIATRINPTQLHRVVRQLKVRYQDTEDTRKNDQDDYAARRLDTTTGMYGAGLGQWELYPTGHETVMTAIHAASAPIAGDDRTPTQRRADALVTIAEIALRSGELPITGGVAPHVSVVVPLATLQAQPQAPAVEFQFGAVTGADWARRYACDGEISRIIIGTKGEILDAGRATRTFTAAQRRAIIVRDEGHCDWAGCDAPAAWCEVHHVVHWADGGPTSVDNGMLLCGRHHDRVHLFGHAVIKGSGPYRVDPSPGTVPNWQAKKRPPPPDPDP